MPPRHMQTSLGCLCLRVQTGIPSRPERKNVPSILSQPISGLWPADPSHAMLVASEYCSQTRRERLFRTGKPVPNSALLATNIASIGGAGVRYGEDGGTFFRSGRTRVRWCCIAIIVCALCGSWMMLLFVGTTTSCRHVYERGFVGAVGAVVGAV